MPTFVDSEAAALLLGHRHALEKRGHGDTVDGAEGLGGTDGHQGGDGSVGRGEVRDLPGAPREAPVGVLARGEEADDVLGRRGRGGPALVPGEGGLQEREAVQDPVADPGAAGIQDHEGRRELPEAAKDVLDVGVAPEYQGALILRALHASCMRTQGAQRNRARLGFELGVRACGATCTQSPGGRT